MRGGTNYEGNLAPCCKRCNSSKSGWLLIEWRTGLRLAPMAYPMPMRLMVERRTRPKATLIQLELKVCPICYTLYMTSRKYCSDRCLAEADARKSRDTYRMAHGLPIDPNRPTVPRKRAA